MQNEAILDQLSHESDSFDEVQKRPHRGFARFTSLVLTLSLALLFCGFMAKASQRHQVPRRCPKCQTPDARHSFPVGDDKDCNRLHTPAHAALCAINPPKPCARRPHEITNQNKLESIHKDLDRTGRAGQNPGLRVGLSDSRFHSPLQ